MKNSRGNSTWRRLLLSGALVFIGGAARLGADVITYEEVIRDTRDPFVLLDFRRDLERTRTLGDGSAPLFEDDDPTIVAENLVSDSFGRLRTDPITYSHIFVPVEPVFQFDFASLEIVAASVSGTPSEGPPPDFIEFLLGLGTPDDPVVGNGIFLGYLNPANPFVESTFQFSTGDSALIGILLADNRLDVTITPMGPGFIGEPDGDKIAVRSSALTVTYRAAEPASLTLILAAGAAAMLVRRRITGRRP